MTYLYNGISLQNKRQSNMDSLLLKKGRIDDKDSLLAVVCDGVGSLSDGAFASGLAARMLNEWFGQMTSVERIGLEMRDTILKINEYIVEESRKININTATTLSVLLLVEDFYFMVHIGDSRIYSYTEKELICHTNDDVSESGKLTAYIGQRNDVIFQYFEGIATGKTFLICSDGLYKRMDMEFLTAKLKAQNKKALKETIKTLTQYVIDCGEQDNITLAIVKIES